MLVQHQIGRYITPKYLNKCTLARTWSLMVWINFKHPRFRVVVIATVFRTLIFICHISHHCCILSSILFKKAWAAGLYTYRYRTQSSRNKRTFTGRASDMLWIKIRKNNGPRTDPSVIADCTGCGLQRIDSMSTLGHRCEAWAYTQDRNTSFFRIDWSLWSIF